MARNGTSLRELEVYYFVCKFFPDSINRYKINYTNKNVEVDIFIPSLRLVIEYDGSYWHKNKIDIDNLKNKKLNELGYKVLRIREYGLQKLDKFDGDVINLQYIHINEKNFDHINLTLQYLSNMAELNLSLKIKSFFVDEIEYNSALKHIYALRYPNSIVPNLTDMCGIELWNEKLNFPLEINNVYKFDWVPAILICKNNIEHDLPRYNRNFKNDCRERKEKCSLCMYNICSLLRYCKKKNNNFIECEYMKNITWEAISKGNTYSSFDGYNIYMNWLFNETKYGIEIIKKFINSPLKSKYRKNILKFLHLDKTSPSYTCSTSFTAKTEEEFCILKKFSSQLDGITIIINYEIDKQDYRLND